MAAKDSKAKSLETSLPRKFTLEKFLLQVRIWSGVSLIVLLGLQIITGYVLAGKIPGIFDYKTEFIIHTQFSWLMIYLILTHATVNLRQLFRRWWPGHWKSTIPPLIAGYIILAAITFYIQFLK